MLRAGVARMMTGVVVVGLVAAGLAAATRPRPPQASALAAPRATAWLADPGRHQLVLADAVTARAVTTVAAEVLDVQPPAQTDAGAVVVGPAGAAVVAAATWRVQAVRDNPGGPETFTVSGGGAVWLVDRSRGMAHRVLPQPADGAAEPGDRHVAVGRDRSPGQVRVADDGTLWFLEGSALHGVRPGHGDRLVDLGGGDAAGRALTLVDGSPVVVERAVARHVDAQVAAVDATWPLPGNGADAGTVADRSEGRVAIVRGRTLVLAGPTGAATVPLTGPDDPGPTAPDQRGTVEGGTVEGEPPDPRFGAPVATGGRFYVADAATGAVLVVHAAGEGATVTRVAVGSPDPLAVAAVNGHVWFSSFDPGLQTTRFGTVTPQDTARFLTVVPDGGDGDGPPGGRSGRSDDRTDPSAVPSDASPTRPPTIDPTDARCPGNLPAARCLPDGRVTPETGPDPGRPTPGCAPDGPAAECAAGHGDGGWPGGGASDEPGATGAEEHGDGGRRSGPAVTIHRDRENPGVGEPVRFWSDAGDARHRWTFAGALPGASQGPTPTVAFAAPGGWDVTLDVPGRPIAHVRVPVGSGVLVRDLAGMTPAQAAAELAPYGITVSTGRSRPSSSPEGTVHAARNGRHVLQIGDALAGLTEVTLELSNGSPPVRKISIGPDHGCALLLDGTVRCWGGSTLRWLATGQKQPGRTGPETIVGLGAVDDIAAGSLHTCALLSDHHVACWGDNHYNQLGPQTTLGHPEPSTPVEIPVLDDVVQLAAGSMHTCALRRTGRVWCWGVTTDAMPIVNGNAGSAPLNGRPQPVGALGDLEFEHLDAAGLTTCAVERGNRRAWCWGEVPDHEGLTPSSAPRPMFDGGVTQVAIGYRHLCALRGGTVTCIGQGDRGQLGTGALRQVGDGQAIADPRDFTAISAGTRHTCGLRRGELVACWGNGATGALGDRATGVAATPVGVVGVSGATQISASGDNTCVLRDDDSVWCWGANPRFRGDWDGQSEPTPAPAPLK